jgi:hypothetical protein
MLHSRVASTLKMFVYLLRAQNRGIAGSNMHLSTWTMSTALQPTVAAKGESTSYSIDQIWGLKL